MTIWKADFTDIDITPDHAVRLQGMAGNPRITDQVADGLRMQMLLIEDERGKRCLILSADLFAFDPSFVARVRSSAKKRGIAAEAILLNASHTHYGPGTLQRAMATLGGTEDTYLGTLHRRIEDELDGMKPRPCRLLHGRCQGQIGVNRRLPKDGNIIFAPNPKGDYERHTPFLIVEWTTRRIVVVNHSCHPTGLSNQNIISADYPGAMRQALTTEAGFSAAMFLQGAGADVKQTTPDGMEFCNSLEAVNANGKHLAEAVRREIDRAVPISPGAFRSAKVSFSYPLPPAPDVLSLEDIAKDEKAHPWEREWAYSLLSNPDYRQPAVEVSVVCLRLGDGPTLIGLDGEPVAGLGTSLRALTPEPQNTWLLGYTNGLVGYYPNEKVCREGGYELDATRLVYLRSGPFGSDFEGRLRQAVTESITRISSQDNYPIQARTGTIR